MSQNANKPKRLSAFLTEHPDGAYCYYSDYAALAAENERLRKAGDELEDDLFLRMNLNARLPSSIAAWNAAKEGRDAK